MHRNFSNKHFSHLFSLKVGALFLFLFLFSSKSFAYETAWFPARVMNLSQVAYECFSHNECNAMIADYFDMPLETLLFGRRQDQMEK